MLNIIVDFRCRVQTDTGVDDGDLVALYESVDHTTGLPAVKGIVIFDSGFISHYAVENIRVLSEDEEDEEEKEKKKKPFKDKNKDDKEE